VAPFLSLDLVMQCSQGQGLLPLFSVLRFFISICYQIMAYCLVQDCVPPPFWGRCCHIEEPQAARRTDEWHGQAIMVR